jgi:hypothetical protein
MSSPIPTNTPLGYLGIKEKNPPDVTLATRAPLITDYKNWEVSDIWLDTLARNAYMMVGRTNTTGIWQGFAGTGSVDLLTGNAGGAVSPDLVNQNINLVGTATNGINVVGNPATNTLTIALQSPYDDGNFRFADFLAVGEAPTGTADLEVTRTAAGKVEASLVNLGNGTAYYSATTQFTGDDCYSTWTCLPNGLLTFGIDHSDSDKIKITGAATPSGGVEFFVITRGAVPTIEMPVGLIQQQFTNIGADVWLYTLNNDNTNAASNSFHEIGVGGAVGGDPFIKYFINGVQSFVTGIDNSASDTFKITDGASPSAGTEFLTITTAGAVNIPLSLAVGLPTLRTAGTFLQLRKNSIAGIAIDVINDDNSNAASHAGVAITTGGAVGGDPQMFFRIDGANKYCFGIDNSDSDKLKIGLADSGVSAAATSWTMTTAGEVTMPLQPAFLAYKSAVSHNQTGDGTIVVVACNTEVFDQNADYNNATFTFWAPITGKHRFTLSVLLSNVGAAHTDAYFNIVTSNRSYVSNINPFNGSGPSGISYNTNCLADMDTGDTAYGTITVLNGAKTVSIQGSAPNTYFCGELTC